MFPALTELNLCDNELTYLPPDMSRLKYLANLNLNGNNFQDSLFINLHQEEQVDFIMRNLEELEFLNGLKVERDILDEETYEEENEEQKEDTSPVKEEPFEEDQEEEDQHNKFKRDKMQEPEPIEEVNETAQESPSQSFQQPEAETSLQVIEAQKDQIINISPEDLEGIATLYDRIRQVRRVNTKMRNNNDKKLAQDFDQHLKKTLSSLEQEVKYHNKDVSVLKAKRQMVEILVQKFCEYLKQIDNRETADITSEISKQYFFLIDQGIFSIKQHQVQGANDSELKGIITQREQEIQSLNEQVQKLNDEVKNLQNENQQVKKKGQKDLDLQAKKLRELEAENRSLRLKVTAIQNQASKVSKVEGVSTDNIENSKMSSNQARSVRQKKHSENEVSHTLKPSASQAKKKFAGPIGPTSQRVLTLKQLKETIDDMYVQKVKFDKKCEENKLPRETMEQYMYTYLNQKYGLKNLIIEWAASIINGIKTYLKDDHDVALYGKILKNECDEEFRYIQMHVKETLTNLLKVMVKEKYPFKPEVEIGKMLDKIQNSTIDEWMWRKIVEKMYDPKDVEILEARFLLTIEEKKIQSRGQKGFNQKYLMETQNSTKGAFSDKKLSREEMMHLMHNKEQEKLTYHDFQKIILDFQLQEHEKFLFKFTSIFKTVDRDNNGVVNEEEFREMLDRLNILDREEEVMYLLQMIDPYNNQKMTYSEVVHLLSSHMVPVDYSNPSHTIPLLEKFVNKYGNMDETEIRRDSDEQDEVIHYDNQQENFNSQNQNENFGSQQHQYGTNNSNMQYQQNQEYPMGDQPYGAPADGQEY